LSAKIERRVYKALFLPFGSPSTSPSGRLLKNTIPIRKIQLNKGRIFLLAAKRKIERKIFLPPAFLGFSIIFLVFSLLLSNSSLLLPKITSGEEGEVVRENGLPSRDNNLTNLNNSFTYSQAIRVDGGSILKEKEKNSEMSSALALVDNNNAIAINSPPSSSQITTALIANSLSNRQGIINYTVQKGDNLAKIAKKFNVSLNTILSSNNLSLKSVIQPGQELIILPVSGVRYKVRQGDTLSGIAKKYHSSVDKIVVFNNLKNSTSIRVGQIIIIPGGYASLSQAQSSILSHGLTPNTVKEKTAISKWPSLPNYFSFPTVSSAHDIGILHHLNAVDITAPCGTPIYAAAAGFIYGIKRNARWYGNEIIIQHENGTVTVYAHLSQILVKEGAKVKQGDLIGRMGKTGNANGCHLHFEVHGAQNPFAKR